MKKFNFVLALAIVVFAVPAFADLQTIAIQISELGFTSDEVAGFAQMVEKTERAIQKDPSLISIENRRKIIPATPVPSGTRVDASIRGAERCTNGCTLRWESSYGPQTAEIYSIGNSVLHRIRNSNGDVFFRKIVAETAKVAPIIQETAKVATPQAPTPAPKAEEAPKALLPEAKKPTKVVPAPVVGEKKAEMPKAPKTALENVERPVEAYVLPVDTSRLGKVVATSIEFPALYSNLMEDGIGKYYRFLDNGEKEVVFMMPGVWRAIVSDDMGNFETFSSIRSKGCDVVHILAVGMGKNDLVGKHKYIVSRDGKKIFLADGTEVQDNFDFERYQNEESFRIDFVKKHPSPIAAKDLLDISPGSKYGEKMAADIKEMFPNDFYIKGERVSFGSDAETLKKLNGEMSGAKIGHRIIKNGGLPVISVSSILFFPFELVRMAIVLAASAAEQPLNGSYSNSQYSGKEVVQTIRSCISGFLTNYRE